MADAFSIVICTHNRSAILARTLEGMTRLEVPPGAEAELVVIVNACTDDSERVAREWVARMPVPTRVVVEPEAGHSVARNRGVAESRHDLIVFTDDDVLIDPRWASEIVAVYREHGERVGVVGGKVELWWSAVERPGWMPKDLEWLLASHDRGDEVKELRTADLFGASFSFRRAVFEQCGPFRKDLGRKGKHLGAFEEAVFIESAIRGGWRAFYTGRARVKHWVHPERATQKFFGDLVYEYSKQRALLPEKLSTAAVARMTAGALWRYVVHGTGVLVARWFPETAWLAHRRVEFHSGRGMLTGLLMRAGGGSMADLRRGA
ncbi:MAG TPA: glycosyltransferase family 2 protein [Phycisphaerales bacterium]|nr:glycosyltransferase family 2 protein [Phycisphaerales bacterium]